MPHVTSSSSASIAYIVQRALLTAVAMTYLRLHPQGRIQDCEEKGLLSMCLKIVKVDSYVWNRKENKNI